MLGGVTLNGPELFSSAIDEQQRLEEEITKLDAFYTARDAKADNPYSKWEQYTHKIPSKTITNGENTYVNKS